MLMEEFKSGNWLKRNGYKSFEPTFINHTWQWREPRINRLLEQAAIALTKLSSVTGISDEESDRFIYMHQLKEADASSRIEGTVTNMAEVLQPKELLLLEKKREDWQEVRNYIKALNQAIADLKTLPLSNRLILKAHETLLQGVRGSYRAPGEFRASQNWIGGSSLQDASFIPPHHTGINDYMGDLEKFFHNDKIDVPHLIKIAIAHYQFETIHPFLDGNGRIGRLIIPIYLIEKDLLRKSCFYLSVFFERNRDQYYAKLMAVRLQNDMIGWILFFLSGVIDIAERAVIILKKIMDIKDSVEKKIKENGGKQIGSMLKIIDCFYKNPFVTIKEIVENTDITYPTANSIVDKFLQFNILTEITGQVRNREFCFSAYYQAFLGD